MLKNTLFLLLLWLPLHGNAQVFQEKDIVLPLDSIPIITAAQQISNWLPLVHGKKIGLVGNHTSILFNEKKEIVHLVDTLLSYKTTIKKVFAPEHGFRGKADAGEHIKNGVDLKTGLPIISLYGKNKKPFPQQLEGIELMVFDIQDVGVRFYTYISTLHYIMEACAENNIPLIVLDRPNPNGHYIDGPILENQFKSFVGMHPVPIVYGMTIGEYAKMINGEKWLKDKINCELTVIPLKNYHHKKRYSLPVKPSPNLPNDTSINLYPSLCFFEGTKDVSVGRGTNMQFQIYGMPNTNGEFCFTPLANSGSKHPKNEGQICCGEDLRKRSYLSEIKLDWIINAYNKSDIKSDFFRPFFEKLVGTKDLREQIQHNTKIINIKKKWKKKYIIFLKTREKYLIYD